MDKAFRIPLRSRLETLTMANELESRGIIPDEIGRNEIFISISGMEHDEPSSTKEELFDKLYHEVEDICAVYELDFTPAIEVVDHCFESEDHFSM